jgi:hypothetical protein
MGPKEVRSTVLTQEEEAAIVAFRKYTLLPLDEPPIKGPNNSQLYARWSEI